MSGRAQFQRAGESLLRATLLSVALFFLHPWRAAAQLSTTNPVSFFTNLSSRFLQAEFGLNLNQIQIYPTNQYTPAVHRLLQVTANLWETTTDSTNNLPTVFRPRFAVTNGSVYLSSYVVVSNAAELDGLPLLDLAASNAAALIPPGGDALVYGVPLVIGARKGLPNFNEFQAEPTFIITRKVELVKPTASSTVVSETNQFFTMALTMPMAAEFWNSYSTNYTRPVTVCITNWTTLTLTNDLGVNYIATFVAGDRWSTNLWPRFNSANVTAPQNKYSFVPMMRTNVPFLPQVGTNIGYIPNTGFVSATNSALFDTSQSLIMPRWGMTISNRLQGAILEQGTGRIIDYALLGNMVCYTNLTDVFCKSPAWNDGGSSLTAIAFEKLWSTNNSGGTPLFSGRPGVQWQVNISRGTHAGLDENIITSVSKFYGSWPGFSSISAAINFFNTFLSSNSPTNRTVVPFCPTFQFSIPVIWQANDPLVHYMASDLFAAQRSYQVTRYDLQSPISHVPLENIGKLNNQYQPWGGNPLIGSDGDSDASNPTLKDPGVISSDLWNFPANSLSKTGWFGKIHRGTPWQTIYLKSADMDRANSIYCLPEWLALSGELSAPARWSLVTGNPIREDSYHSRPVRDRSIVALLQSLLNTNAPQHLLSVNDRNPANWRAVLDGMTVLTNTSSTQPVFESLIMTSNSPQAALIADAIATARRNQPSQVFNNVGELLGTPELSSQSPWLNLNALARGLTDEAIECIPTQLLLLVRADSIGEVRVSGPTTQIQFTGFDGYPYAVESSSNLGNWISVSTNYPTNGVFEFVISPTTSSNTFYRSVLLP